MSLKYTFSYFIALLLWQLTASGCNRANPQAAGPQMPPAPLVTVAKAQKQDVPLYLDEIGKSGGSESVTVTPQVGGRITERHFQDGADLTKGALLFVIDPRPYQAQLDSARASLAQAKAALALAKAQFARDEELVGSKAISKQDYDTKKNTVDVDLAQVESAEAVLETAKLNATMSNPDHHFWPGQFVNVRLVLATQKNAVLIPNQATQISQKGPFVYVVKPDGTADFRPVTLGQRQGENVVITQGVAAGENVIVTGQMTVPPGGKVRVDTGAAPGPGGAPADAGAAGTK